MTSTILANRKNAITIVCLCAPVLQYGEIQVNFNSLYVFSLNRMYPMCSHLLNSGYLLSLGHKRPCPTSRDMYCKSRQRTYEFTLNTSKKLYYFPKKRKERKLVHCAHHIRTCRSDVRFSLVLGWKPVIQVASRPQSRLKFPVHMETDGCAKSYEQNGHRGISKCLKQPLFIQHAI